MLLVLVCFVFVVFINLIIVIIFMVFTTAARRAKLLTVVSKIIAFNGINCTLHTIPYCSLTGAPGCNIII